jgi:hypothetical protein
LGYGVDKGNEQADSDAFHKGRQKAHANHQGNRPPMMTQKREDFSEYFDFR